MGRGLALFFFGAPLARSGGMFLPSFLRAQFYAIAVLGVVASSLAAFGMLRVLALNEAGRRGRAHDLLNEELTRISSLPRTASEPAQSTVVGLRAGWDSAGAVPAVWQQPIADVLRAAGEQHARVSTETELAGFTLLLVAEPVAGAMVWAGLPLRPGAYLSQWRALAIGTVVITLLLVSLTVWSALTFRRSSEEARRANERLTAELARQERLAALGRVAAGVAHEVRNPLAAIKLRLDLAAAGADLSPKLLETVQVASAEISRLDRLVSDLLIVAGRKLAPKKATDLRRLVDQRVEGMAAWAKERGVGLRVSGGGESEIDPESFARALDNVLRNAVEASPRGGEVSVLVDGRAIDVQDVGAGVESEAKLFEPFFTTKPEGTGLGLAISRAIVRAHGGELSYARREGKTSMTLRIGAA
jgi:signal transduction histidine kinase